MVTCSLVSDEGAVLFFRLHRVAHAYLGKGGHGLVLLRLIVAELRDTSGLGGAVTFPPAAVTVLQLGPLFGLLVASFLPHSYHQAIWGNCMSSTVVV